MMAATGQDSARSWVVAFSCSWINFFSAMMYKSSGVVYVGILQTLNVTREDASWPLTLLAVFIFATGTSGFVGARGGFLRLMHARVLP